MRLKVLEYDANLSSTSSISRRLRRARDRREEFPRCLSIVFELAAELTDGELDSPTERESEPVDVLPSLLVGQGLVQADGFRFGFEAVEKRHILRVLDQESGNKSAAARILGISRKTLERKSQAWGLD